MPQRFRPRRRRSFDQQFDWNAEKAASEVHPPERRVYVPVNESLAGSSIMTCCGEYRCVCVCPACGEHSVTGMVCAKCEDAPAWLDTLRACGAL